MSTRPKHLPALDGLRALSILAVIAHHGGGAAAGAASPLGRGHLGVQLFFVLSGFLITSLLIQERARSGGIDLARFYVRRSLRIFPLYFAVLALYVVVVGLTARHEPAGRAFFANLPYFATYTSNWMVSLDEPRVIFYFAWSLAVEEQFYLVW
ncbi:MAG: acyltransferase, partial [Proteobacteria bacterium]|nr:acyltransferase [Pseudomonadota bacterium]